MKLVDADSLASPIEVDSYARFRFECRRLDYHVPLKCALVLTLQKAQRYIVEDAIEAEHYARDSL